MLIKSHVTTIDTSKYILSSTSAPAKLRYGFIETVSITSGGCLSYLVRMFDVDAKAELLQQASFALDHLILQIHISVIQKNRVKWPVRSQCE